MDILELIDDKDQTIAECSQRPFQCPELDCIKSFNRKSDLQRHHRIHTNERPYSCEYRGCGKSFIQRSALTVHIRTHTGEKPHKCEYLGCGKCFSDSSSLARHRRIHTGKRPYRCPIDGCEKSFCRKTTLTKHARRQHQLLENEGPESEIDETDEDSPRKTSSAVKAQQKKVAARRLQLQRKDNGALLSTTMFRQTSYQEPLTPHTPMSYQSSRAPSYTTSSPGCYSDSQMSMHMAQSMHQPLTPQSSYYDEEEQVQHHHRPMSPNGAFDGMRLMLDAPTPHQLLVAQQTLQSSPGSLSSCSSTSSGSQSSVDYFGRAPHSSTPYQSPYMSPVPQYQNQYHTQYQPAPYVAPVLSQIPQMHAQQVWYENHQHQLISNGPAPPRIDYGYMDMPCIKQEPDHNMLPSPRGFC